MLLQMTLFRSFLWLISIPLYICTTFSLSIHLLANVNQHLEQPKCCSMSWLLQIVLQ